jgi:prepilin-type N-terminal cleavage/methylation domain-containing protein
MRRSPEGFTLIELMVVVTIVAIIASIAIPNMMSARSTANEKTVIATMRSIVTAQQLARTNGTVDVNNNGQGEAATLPELAGTQALRGTTTFLRPAFLSASLGNIDADGHGLSHGFYFALYLPDASGLGLATTAASLPSVDARMAESFWTCLAWPRDRRVQGYGTFFTYQAGDIMVARGATYSGKTSVPPAGAGLVGVPATQINSNESAAGGGTAADGNVWRIVP